MAVNPCVICGQETPEGRLVCASCEREVMEDREPRVYKFTIYMNPVTKKNSNQIVRNPRTGRWFIAPSAQYKKYCRECLKQIMTWTDRPKEPIDFPVNCKYLFFKETHRLCDDLNHSEAIDDILVQAGVLADDNRDIVANHDGTRILYDKERPRVEITITEVFGWERWSDAKNKRK